MFMVRLEGRVSLIVLIKITNSKKIDLLLHFILFFLTRIFLAEIIVYRCDRGHMPAIILLSAFDEG